MRDGAVPRQQVGARCCWHERAKQCSQSVEGGEIACLPLAGFEWSTIR